MSTSTKKTGAAKAGKDPKGIIPPVGGGSGFLSDVIVELGFAERDTVEEAVRAARSPGTTVGGVLVEQGAITEDQLARATAERYAIDYIDLAGFEVDPAAANLIKPSAARRYQAVPVAYLGSGLLVAMADPADALGVNDIAVMTKLEVRPAVASRPALEALLAALPLDEKGWQAEGEAVAVDVAPAGPVAEPDEAPPAEEAPAEEPPEAPASAAVFWQDGAGELPEESAVPEAGDALRDELTALKTQLAGAEAKLNRERKAAAAEDGAFDALSARLAEAEAELDQARGRVREAKEVGAELETLREKLSAAEAGLDQAAARARDNESLAAEVQELRLESEQQRARVSALKQERDELRAELRRVGAEAEVRGSELESLRAKVTDVETELVRARSDAEAAGVELEATRTRAEAAEKDAEESLRRASESERHVEEARRRAIELSREAEEAQKLAAELESADARAEHARQALTELRDENERQREQAAMAERELRDQLDEEKQRRAELEERLSEVEGAAFAAERSFEELRVAQGRMRDALRALADPPTAAES